MKRRRSKKSGSMSRDKRLSAGDMENWIPCTRLGRLVAEGGVETLDQALESGLPIKEPEIISTLAPELEDEVLDINMVQRMTDSGRRVKFRATVAVGNRNGLIGFGQGKDRQVGSAIKKAVDNAVLNIVRIKRGCGSWECVCGLEHTVPFEVEGKAGSVKVVLKPAPSGLGIASGESARKVLELAGIKDAWTRSEGQTKTTLNFAKATFNALQKTTTVRAQEDW